MTEAIPPPEAILPCENVFFVFRSNLEDLTEDEAIAVYVTFCLGVVCQSGEDNSKNVNTCVRGQEEKQPDPLFAVTSSPTHASHPAPLPHPLFTKACL